MTFDVQIFLALIVALICSVFVVMIFLVLSSVLLKRVKDSDAILIGVIIIATYTMGLLGFFLHDWILHFFK